MTDKVLSSILVASLLCLHGSFALPCDQQLATSRQLYLSVVTQDYVSVSYVDPSGSGIQLVAKPSGYSVTDMKGSNILNMDDQFYKINGMTYRLIEIKDESFLQEVGDKDKSEIYLTSADVASFKASFYSSNAAQCDQTSSQASYKLSSNAHIKKLHQLVRALLEDPHMQLLVETAIALGKDGVTGYDFPVMLPFYMTAVQIRSLLNHPTVQTSTMTESSQDHGRECLDQCPLCRENGCPGICGKDCECWPWVCGDCCFHQGCYDHNRYCLENSYSLACLFPWNFSCDSYKH